MAKLIPYDVTGVEESGGGTGVKVKPGVRPARIVRCAQRTQKRNGDPVNDLEIALDVGSEFDWVFTYVGLDEASDWKLAEFVRALGLKDKGKIDPDKLVGQLLRVKINPGEYDGQYSPSAGRLMKAQSGDEDALGESVSELSSSNGSPEPDEDADASVTAEVDGDDDFEPSREGDEFGSYDDWSDEDLIGEAEDRGLTLAGGRGNKKDKAIKALRADDAAQMGDDDGDGDDAVADDDYDDWDLDRLKAEWEEREMGDLPAVRGRNADDRLKAKIVEQLREDDNENPFEP